jgi:acyl-CoA synthetase (AMP-forming)/AMP-acid ligase II
MSHFRRALEALPDTQLVHVYGPTETTTFATSYRLPQSLPASVTSIPIGKPIANTTAFVLDDHRQLVPIGLVGELYIGGEGVAREYLRRPELTAEKFIADPFGRAGGRLYRTGDLVRMLPGGDIEFLGRIDDQIKGRWTFSWRHDLSGKPLQSEIHVVDVVARELPAVSRSLTKLRSDIEASGAIARSHDMLPFEIRFMKLERAAVALLAENQDNSKSGDLIRKEIKGLRELRSGEPVPAVFHPEAIRSREADANGH